MQTQAAALAPAAIPNGFARAFQPLIDFDRPRFRCYAYHGGRGSAKSVQFARALLLIADHHYTRTLCTREFQRSIADSVHLTLSDEIRALGAEGRFSIRDTWIENLVTGSVFLFGGLRVNPKSLKSIPKVNICWVEEADVVSESSWQTLIPTIREPGSEIWISFNPCEEDAPTYKRFVLNPPPRSLVRKVTWRDNPWFSRESAEERDHLRSTDPEAYMHVWEGEVLKRSAAQILAGKWKIDDFAPGPEWDGPYFGADWGFSQDPTTLLKVWINDGNLYVEHEAYKVGCELDDTPALFDKVPGSRRYRIRADNSRPETISHIRRAGFDVVACDKWPGCVEDGIAHLRQYKQIVIHPRCRETILEARLYSYKVDKRTGDPLPDVLGKHDHCIDAIRYALGPMIARGKTLTGPIHIEMAG